jgi:hypothetical protein
LFSVSLKPKCRAEARLYEAVKSQTVMVLATLARARLAAFTVTMQESGEGEMGPLEVLGVAGNVRVGQAPWQRSNLKNSLSAPLQGLESEFGIVTPRPLSRAAG